MKIDEKKSYDCQGNFICELLVETVLRINWVRTCGLMIVEGRINQSSFKMSELVEMSFGPK